MIDLPWFARVSEIAGADFAGRDPATMADMLGETGEVLPHLVTLARGFADWPLARAALRVAAKSHTGPTHLRPATDGAPRRAHAVGDLRQPLNALLVANSVHWKPDWEERGPATADIEKLLRLARLESGDADDSPELFIGFE